MENSEAWTIVQQNKKFINYCVGLKFGRMIKASGADWDDAKQIARLAFFHAVQTFDGSKGANLINWAAIQIRGALQKHCRREIIETTKTPTTSSNNCIQKISNIKFRRRPRRRYSDGNHIDQSDRKILADETVDWLYSINPRWAKLLVAYCSGLLVDVSRQRIEQIKKQAQEMISARGNWMGLRPRKG